MKKFRVGNLAFWAFGLGVVAVGCGGSSNGSGLASLASVGGTSVNGGTSGAVSGGPPAAGGVVNNGGAATKGGTPGTTSTSMGGATASGGNAVGGATNGGNSAAGGAPATGGGVGQGGSSGNGGTSGVGASATTGGATNTAGAKATGGATATGGKAGAAGATATGGAKATGGASATGGAISSGTAGAAGKPYKGVANSPCAARTALNVSWYYNWETAPREPCSSASIGGEYVPMIKGNNHRTPAAVSDAVSAIANAGYKTVLGFNEPNKTNQGNQTVALSVSLWPSMLNSALRVGSPATSAEWDPGQLWFIDFMGQVNANTALRVDFLAIHWYGWNAGSCDANATQLENYVRWAEGFAGNRPIWITEFGCGNVSNPDMATVQAFFTGALAMFARHPRIERYAWYPWIANNGLTNADGTLTSLGTVFAAAPAYK